MKVLRNIYMKKRHQARSRFPRSFPKDQVNRPLLFVQSPLADSITMRVAAAVAAVMDIRIVLAAPSKAPVNIVLTQQAKATTVAPTETSSRRRDRYYRYSEVPAIMVPIPTIAARARPRRRIRLLPRRLFP